MRHLKFRTFYDSSDSTEIYIGIDTFENLIERASKDGKYSLAVNVGGANGEFYKTINLSEDNITILNTDVIRMPTMFEYRLMSEALKNKHLRFNRKTGEIIYVEK